MHKLFAALLACSVFGQSQQQPQTVIRSSVREVVLDVMVRNKGEKMVRDLKQSDLEVYVDGVKQKIQSFRLVNGSEIRKLEAASAAAPTTTAAAPVPDSLPAPNSPREINLVALVFRAGSTEERARARAAALTFFDKELRPNTYISLVTIRGLRSRTVVPFTSNRARLVTGMDHVFGPANTRDNSSELAGLQLPGANAASGSTIGAPPTQGQLDNTNAATSKLDASISTGMGASTVRSLELEVAHMDLNTAAMFEMDRLREVLDMMAGLPGRKTVVAMINTVTAPPEQIEVFQRVIDMAKRRQITFYGVNLQGLSSAGSSAALASSSITSAAAISQSQGKSTNPGGVVFQSATRSQIHQDELQLAAVRSFDSKNSLRILAESTGGFLIADTNDVASQMPRIMDEVNTHYELAWTPSHSPSDGKFHRVEVRVKHPGYVALHRDGYFALPDLPNHPKFEGFEIAALRELNRRPLPAAFDFRVRALRFKPDRDSGDWNGLVAFEAPIAGFSVIDPAALTGNDGGRMQVRASAVALIKNEKGDIVDFVSNKLGYDVPSARGNNFLEGNLNLTLPIKLPPGRWVIEGLMYSPTGDVASARRIAVLIPKPGDLSVSSISLVRRVDGRSEEEAKTPGPFDMGTSRVRPTLTGIVPNGAEARLYFVVYPPPAESGKPHINIQYWRDGKPVAGDAIDGAPDATGAVPVLAAARLEPGDYEVRVLAKLGTYSAEETGWLRVEP